MNSIKFDSMTPIQFIILLLVVSVLLFLLYLEPRLGKKKLTNRNEHGSSKFADIKEIRKTFIKEKIIGAEKVGFPVWYEKKNGKFENVYLDDKSPHYLFIGSTGSGKSVTVVLNECLMFATSKEKHSVVVTDPKGEIFRATSKVFSDNSYNVVTIDFRNPSKSKRINIMQPIIDEWKEHCKYSNAMLFLLSHFIKTNKIKVEKLEDNKYLKRVNQKIFLDDYLIDIIRNYETEINEILNNKKMYENMKIKSLLEVENNLKEYLLTKTNEQILTIIRYLQNICSKHQAETNRLVISLADLIFVDKDSNDKFWINSSKQLFIGIVGIFLEDYKAGLIGEEKINIASVKKFQNSSLIKENQNYLQRNLNTRKYGSLSKDYLTSILTAAENTYKSITAVFGEKMAIFDDLNVENITSTNEFNFTDLGSRPTALYIIVPDEDRAYFQLVTIIIGMLTKDLTKFANQPENKGVLPVKIEWILDEFANCPPLNSIETLVSVARSRGMRFQFFIQSFSQLEQVYGKEVANIIIDNTALCYLKTNSVDCAERIMKKLGKSTIETNSINKSTDPMKIGANQTTSLMGKDLLNATEIMSLKYKTIIFPTISNPIFRDTYLYSDVYPQYKDIEELQRDTKILKRTTSNYYTVEELRELHNKQTQKLVEKVTKKAQNEISKKINKSIKETLKAKTNSSEDVIMDIRKIIPSTIDININEKGNKEYLINIQSLLSNKVIDDLLLNDNKNTSMSVARNINSRKTKIKTWDNIREKKL